MGDSIYNHAPDHNGETARQDTRRTPGEHPPAEPLGSVLPLKSKAAVVVCASTEPSGSAAGV